MREWRLGKSWPERDLGWARLGVRVIHAKRARSKPAELVGGLLQNLQERVPGYCGRDERRDCPELTRRNKMAVEARRVEPHGLFLSHDAWMEELDRLIAIYNAAPQDGRILNGRSPDEVFKSSFPNGELTRLDARCWHWLAHYVSERTVTKDGIRFSIGREKFEYSNEALDRLRGRQVLAWFDPEYPELLGVTDLKELNPLLVERTGTVHPLGAYYPEGSDERTRFEKETGRVQAINAYRKARFNSFKGQFEPTFRTNIVAPAVQEVAETFKRGRDQIAARQREQQSRQRTVRQRAPKLGAVGRLAGAGGAMDDIATEMMLEAEREQANGASRETKIAPGGVQ
jgi:hypothetical protein